MSADPTLQVSVLLPVYNAGRYLPEALESILAQENICFECVAVDDGSTDDTADILNDFARRDARLRVLSRPNTGIVGALNDGLALCRAPYIARMDADDIARPARLARQAAYLDTHADCVGVGSWVDYLDPEGEHIWTWKMSANPAQIEHDLLEGGIGGLVHPAMMLRADAIRAVGGYQAECKDIEDYDLFLRLLEQGHFSVLPEPLLGYRQHPASINATSNRGARTAIANRLMAEARQQRGLPEKVLTPTPATPESSQLEWIDLALLDGNWRSARKTTCRLFRSVPLKTAPWQALGKLIQAALGKLRIRAGRIRQFVSIF
ncbi:glycosyltransferase [Ruficoccus amylovorans]|uniref:Glycosyltransferase n=1 Tax=Ruficoccus amylovorans TaxID=1804625 RepID=A0A842HE65_9BACT|nr:glycosyltransferase [Ruficoccus amylovorans]MBC2594539.1 glycosyltransferase [Ruficoccus amylovorans]